jgi:hypothetical protein
MLHDNTLTAEKTPAAGSLGALPVLLALWFTLSFSMPAHALIKSASWLWTVTTHPVECLMNDTGRTAAEMQHCIPRSLGGSDETIAYWIRSNHTVSDRWRNRPFLDEKEHWLLSLLTLGVDASQENLNAAYRMGAYGIPYTVFFHHYQREESQLVMTRLDGPSNLLYGLSWALCSPKKLLWQIAYDVSPDTAASKWFLLDLIVAIPVWILDLALCAVCSAAGVVIGTILHPINSIFSLGGLVWFVPVTIWNAVAEIFSGSWAIVVSLLASIFS